MTAEIRQCLADLSEALRGLDNALVHPADGQVGELVRSFPPNSEQSKLWAQHDACLQRLSSLCGLCQKEEENQTVGASTNVDALTGLRNLTLEEHGMIEEGAAEQLAAAQAKRRKEAELKFQGRSIAFNVLSDAISQPMDW